MNIRNILAMSLGALLVGHAEGASMQTIGNNMLKVTYEEGTGRVSVREEGGTVSFITDGRLSREKGVSRVADIDDPVFGKGKSIEVRYEDGYSDRLMVYPEIPFVFVQPVFRNKTSKEVKIKTVRPFSAAIDLGVPFEQLKTLGTAGLTAPDGHSGSYVFLATADPATRRGVVSAWLTHDRGSGILFSSRDGTRPRVDAQIDYGRLLIGPGQEAVGETLAIGVFDDARIGLEQWADLVARNYKIKLPEQPDGYCTWYSSPNGGASDAVHLAELADFSARELKPFGFDFVQIDDKWQDGKRRNGPANIFCRHNPAGPYPEGMKPTADHIRSLGLTAGIWFMPFAGDHDDPFFKDRLHWFVQKPDGTPYHARWGGTSMDMTHPEARDYLAEVVKLLSHEWGYKYFKMDGLWVGTATKLLYVNNAYQSDDIGEPVFHQQEKTPIEAFRSGLKLVREAAGDDVFFLGCCISQNMRSFGGSLGLVDAMRVGPDNGPGWGGIRKGPWHGSNRYFLHGRIWYNDPDPVYIRTNMSTEHARFSCSWVGVTGQFNVSSDWLPGMPAERIDILKRILPTHNLLPRPVDLLEKDLANVWLLTDTASGVRRDVVGLFNWSDKETLKIAYPLERLGLPPAEGYVGFDYWNNQFIPPFKDTFTADVPAGACRVLALCAVSKHPQVVSTSRHVTQGIVDLEKEEWDPAAGVLSGRSRVVKDDPYQLRILVPAGERSWQATEATMLESGVGDIAFKQDGVKLRIDLSPERSGTISWKIRFKRGPVKLAPPPKVTGLQADPFYTLVRLSWDAADAEGYRVTRSDGKVWEVPGNTVSDADFERGTRVGYTVQALNWSGALGPVAEVSVVTEKELKRPPIPPMPEIHIADLKALTARTGWGKVHTNRSCEGKPMTLEGTRYEKGMGVHANALLVYAIPEGVKRFVALVGLDDERKEDPRASVVCKVFGDVKEMGEQRVLLAESPTLSNATLRTWCFDVALTDRLREIHLVVEDAGDDINCDHADWVNAGFIR